MSCKLAIPRSQNECSLDLPFIFLDLQLSCVPGCSVEMVCGSSILYNFQGMCTTVPPFQVMVPSINVLVSLSISRLSFLICRFRCPSSDFLVLLQVLTSFSLPTFLTMTSFTLSGPYSLPWIVLVSLLSVVPFWTARTTMQLKVFFYVEKGSSNTSQGSMEVVLSWDLLSLRSTFPRPSVRRCLCMEDSPSTTGTGPFKACFSMKGCRGFGFHFTNKRNHRIMTLD